MAAISSFIILESYFPWLPAVRSIAWLGLRRKLPIEGEIHLPVKAIVLGRGVPLWNGLGGLHERFDISSVTSPNGVTHVFLTRRDRG